ncbi:CRPV-099 [Crowpox virus]|nr:CRPV-099 [Crowpox virus]
MFCSPSVSSIILPLLMFIFHLYMINDIFITNFHYENIRLISLHHL